MHNNKVDLKNSQHTAEGSLSERHIAQIIRRNMILKVKPSGKLYKRKKYSKKDLVN
jgi:hypothetical protein